MPLCMSFPSVSLQAYIGEVVHEDNFFIRTCEFEGKLSV